MNALAASNWDYTIKKRSRFDWHRRCARQRFGSTTALFLALFGLLAKGAEHQLAWVQRYGNVVNLISAAANKVAVDPYGDIIASGTANDRVHGLDFLTVKYSGTNGARLWERRYNGPIISEALVSAPAGIGNRNSQDLLAAMAVDSAGDVVVSGTSANRYGYDDSYTAKYARSNGAVIWANRSPSSAKGNNTSQAMVLDEQGNVLITGSVFGTNFDYQGYTAKYESRSGGLLWERRIHPGFPGGLYAFQNSGFSLGLDSTGNVIVRGNTTGCCDAHGYLTVGGYLAAYRAADGAVLWETTSLNTEPSLACSKDIGVYISNNYLVKFSARDGREIWYTRLTNSGAFLVHLDIRGDILMPGIDATSNLASIAKFSGTNGALIWNFIDQTSDQQYRPPTAIATDTLGDVVVVRHSYHLGVSNEDISVTKHSGIDGSVLWTRLYDSPAHRDDIAFAVGLAANGDPVVTGCSSDDSNSFHGSGSLGNRRYFTARYSATNGATEWQAIGSVPASSVGGSAGVAVDSSGNPIVTGYSYNENYNKDYYTVKYDAATSLPIWSQRFDSNPSISLDDEATAIGVDLTGNVFVTGYSVNPYPASDLMFSTVKYAATDGSLLWKSNLRASFVNRPLLIALDLNGNPVIAGDLNHTPLSGVLVAKYSNLNGDSLGEWFYRNPASPGNDTARAVTFDLNNNIIAAGVTYSSQGNADFYVVKGAGATLASNLWEKTYDSPAHGDDVPVAIATDSQGNILVTGSSGNFSGSSDFYTAQLAAADGRTLWETRYNAPAELNDAPSAVAVDVNGDVIVTGASFNTRGNSDYYTAKYASATGAILWEVRYNGPGDSEDAPLAVALDSNRNVVVTGYSYNREGNADYYTACYASENGSVLWEQRYDGPAGGEDKPAARSSLALGPGGSVYVTGTSQTGPLEAGGTEYATVKYVPSPHIENTYDGRGYNVLFSSDPGRNYRLQRATEVVGPWTTLTNIVAPSSGYVSFTEPVAQPTSAFYRLVLE